jgi:hypothetical protein
VPKLAFRHHRGTTQRTAPRLVGLRGLRSPALRK